MAIMRFKQSYREYEVESTRYESRPIELDVRMSSQAHRSTDREIEANNRDASIHALQYSPISTIGSHF